MTQLKIEADLRIIIEGSVTAFTSITKDEWFKKSNPSKWSKLQILGHLIDSALTNLRRFVMTQYAPEQKIIYHQDEWVDIQKYQRGDVEELIELWRLLNLQIARVMHTIPDDRLQNLCDTGKDQTEYHSLAFLIADYVEHLKHHLKQIIGDNNYLSQDRH